MTAVIAVILGGGRGTRMFPLTLPRSKPAVPIGGKYRLIDVPVSNCLHSDIRRIYVLTQYQSESLNKHINNTYKFDIFSSGFVAVVAAEQTEESGEWFQGTADAVRQSMRHVGSERWEDIIILSGDQLYRMDFREMLETHRSSRADATVAMKPVPAEQAFAFGIMQVDKTGRIIKFDEKPPADRLPGLVSPLPGGPAYLASMGIYIFRRRALDEALSNTSHQDFGRHVIPGAVPRLRVQAHVHDGYWEDVGTIGSYFQANLALTDPRPEFNFYDAHRPIYTHPRFLPAARLQDCRVDETLIADGADLDSCDVTSSIVGLRMQIHRGARISRSILLGADSYEDHASAQPIGIGPGAVLDRVIVDKNARIGEGSRLVNERGIQNVDGDGYYIRSGIIVVPKNGVVKPGTVV
jgi:glucose-1-phosphate adenylyltransferase